MAEGVTVANAYVQIMPSALDAKQSITDAILPAAESAGDEAGGSIGSAILSKIGALKGPLMAVGGTILGAVGVSKIAGALMDIGGEFDDMTDSIVVSTGASGDALDSLVSSAESIATTVPVSFGEAGSIVGDISARMGLVGDDLEGVGSRVAALGQMLGKSVNMDALTGSLNAFGVAGEDASAKMDYLFGVSQNTGMGFDKLTGVLESNAPALQSLGFSFEEAANMAGLLDKAGLDAGGTMSKMSRALVELSEPGESAEEAFQRVVGQMGDYIAAGDEASALDIASDIFGTKGAAQFVAAVKSGSVSLDQLTDSALGAGDGIMGTLEATMDWPERMELMGNKAKKALEPLGGALMDGATKATEKLSEAMGEIDPAVFEELGTMLGDVLSGAVDVLSGALTFLVDHKEQIGAFFGAIVGAVQAVIDIIGPLIGGFIDAATSIPAEIDAMKTSLSATWDSIKTTVSQTWENIKTSISTAIENAKTTVSTTVSNIRQSISDAFENAKTNALGIFDGIRDGISERINSAKDTVSGVVDRVKEILSGSIDFPHINLPHFSVSGGEAPYGLGGKGSLPSFSVAWYAAGGFVNEPTVISIAGEKGGELVWPSYEPYLSRYATALAGAMPNGAGGTNVYINGARVNDDEDIKRLLGQFLLACNRKWAM